MNIVLTVLLTLTNVSSDDHTTGFIHQIRADLALAERVVLKPSPTKGGGTFTITDANDLRFMARAIDRKSEVVEFNFRAGSADYVIVDIFVDGTSEHPELRITFLSTAALFTLNDTQYMFRNADRATFKALLKMIANRKRD